MSKYTQDIHSANQLNYTEAYQKHSRRLVRLIDNNIVNKHFPNKTLRSKYPDLFRTLYDKLLTLCISMDELNKIYYSNKNLFHFDRGCDLVYRITTLTGGALTPEYFSRAYSKMHNQYMDIQEDQI